MSEPTIDQVLAMMKEGLGGDLPGAVTAAAGVAPDLVLRHASDSAYAMPREGGALDPATRTLIYLGVALATGSQACIEAMTGKAKAQGIGKEQILETIRIARFAEASRVFGGAEHVLAALDQ